MLGNTCRGGGVCIAMRKTSTYNDTHDFKLNKRFLMVAKCIREGFCNVMINFDTLPFFVVTIEQVLAIMNCN